MNVTLEGRQDIAEMMTGFVPPVIFSVDDTVLFQSNASPFDLATAPSNPINGFSNGHYARARALSDTQAIAVQGATIGAQLWECQTLGDAQSTPNTAALMDTSKNWKVQLDIGGDFVAARALSIKPSEARIGWKVIVEVVGQ